MSEQAAVSGLVSGLAEIRDELGALRRVLEMLVALELVKAGLSPAGLASMQAEQVKEETQGVQPPELLVQTPQELEKLKEAFAIAEERSPRGSVAPDLDLYAVAEEEYGPREYWARQR